MTQSFAFFGTRHRSVTARDARLQSGLPERVWRKTSPMHRPAAAVSGTSRRVYKRARPRKRHRPFVGGMPVANGEGLERTPEKVVSSAWDKKPGLHWVAPLRVLCMVVAAEGPV